MRLTQRKRRSKNVLIGLAIAVAVYLWFCWALSTGNLMPDRRAPASVPPEVTEQMAPSAAGPNPTWVSKNFQTAPVVYVLAFGLGGNRDYWTPVIHALDGAGFASVTPCMPGQDASPAKRVGFGIDESTVLASTVEWIRSQRKDHPKIVLEGISMGGAACWLATDQVRVDGVITESAYGHLQPTVKQNFERRFKGAYVVFRPVVWFGQWRTGLNPSSVNPASSAARWKGPALVIQAGSDKLVEPWQGKELAQVSGAEYWEVPGAEHAQCLEVAGPEFLERIVGFGKTLSGR